MTQSTGLTALITGASSGLGREYARLFAADGHDVVLVARRRERLDQLSEELSASAGVRAHVVPADLCEDGAPEAVCTRLREAGVDIEFLVNNAGFGSNGAFAELPLERELDMVTLNIHALVHLTGLLLPAMCERGSGRILNIGSTAGFQPGPFMSTYYATKAFVNHFTEGLAHELADSGVSATVSCPGATASEFAEHAGNDKSRLFGAKVADAETVAREGYEAMMAGRPMVVHGARNRLLVQSLRLSPRRLVSRIAARLNLAAE
ncbi:SDR family NAD(P)-dependent oxidoreductase [Haliangium ochraceum]|uniref:Short-chain dehydrogenase/reductase SDR n=1 Tax=Haliangium ochraceum (strain DSM 14365 / JCM 11303 / SMP-2) TaxID=502025 RepID=D0LHU5_HALO1|nr:SDR family oxidoreductase [Haliangium ochraceum]ACY14774.1 short-chain dehydrogenase/reductase SDR [Haliangium ochraceum DSM 14365]